MYIRSTRSGNPCKTCVRGLLTDKSSQNEYASMKSFKLFARPPVPPKFKVGVPNRLRKEAARRDEISQTQLMLFLVNIERFGGRGDGCCGFGHRCLPPFAMLCIICFANFCPSTVGDDVAKVHRRLFLNTTKLKNGNVL